MPNSVLILDDDADFNSLLTDIFEQADYIVTSITDPIEALEVSHETHYDLVVTDQKMPQMTGCEFMRTIKEEIPDLPVIMVSGYLENDIIRELISEGVGGVFLKPLNIFSLLERSAELVEESKKLKRVADGDLQLKNGNDDGASLGFTFRSYPCKSRASVAFAERIHSLRNFKSTLSLIGGPGVHYRSICEDIAGFYDARVEHFTCFTEEKFSETAVLEQIDAAQKKGAERVTCVLLALEAMDESQKVQATQLVKKEGAFEEIGLNVRVIFCISHDLDTLFDRGMIDENLYILMGSAEVEVPSLRDCKVDVGIMAHRLVVQTAREFSLTSVPRFDSSARNWIRQQKWENNYEELEAVVRKVMENRPGEVIQSEMFQSALKSAEKVTPRIQMNAHFLNQHLDYIRAASILFNHDFKETAAFWGTSAESIKRKLK